MGGIVGLTGVFVGVRVDRSVVVVWNDYERCV